MTARLRYPLAITAVLLLATLPSLAQKPCPNVRVPYVSASEDGGRTFLTYRGRPPMSYFLTWGLAAAGSPGLVYMNAADSFWVSEDDGCNWTQLDTTTSGLIRVVSGPGVIAYGWPQNGGSVLYQLGPSSKGTIPYAANPRSAPESSLQGFGVDATNDQHVRTIGRYGQIYDSTDGGFSWRAIGNPVPAGGSILPYFGSFDAQNLDHAVYGRALEGGYVTFDGGATWTKSSGLSTGNVNFFNGVISPVDGNVVFGMGLDFVESNAGAPSDGRHIYASLDGGLTYTPVLDHGTAGVVLQNGPLMVADDTNADVLNFVFSVRPVFGGTTFYRYDLGTGSLTLTPNPSINTVRSMTFSKIDPAKMLAGFEFVP